MDPTHNSPRLARLSLRDYELPPGLAARLHSPALLVFDDKVRANVQQMLRYLEGRADRWRPHLKTTKTPEVWRELVLAGVRNFKCATTKEAAVLAALLDEMSIDDADLLVAYPLLSPNLDKVARLAQRYPNLRLSILSEDPAHAGSLPVNLGVFVDINPEMNRTGVPMKDTAAIAAVARAAKGRLRGLHFYDGHVREPGAEARQSHAWRLYQGLLEIVNALQLAGLDLGELITSGTSAFPYALAFPGFANLSGLLHRVSPGTVVFHDGFSDDLLEDVSLSPAALLFTRVVSQPAADIVTCDAGSKSLAAEAGDPAAFVLGRPQLLAQKPSEEHLPLRVLAGQVPARGTELLLIPRHVCPTVNLADELVLVSGSEEWQTVAVRARGHDLIADSSGPDQ